MAKNMAKSKVSPQLKSSPKIALVHDYLSEFGGAERVLLALSEIWPEAPIYTAFYKTDSPAWERFKNKDVRTSWVHHIPFFADKLHSPLRFLAPAIWNSFDFTEYDVVIGSASWYITKGFTKKSEQTKEICYCHTPPRWLYGYPTSVEWQRYWPVRLYGIIVGHFMRMYDGSAAQRVDQFIANSKNTARRIEKFYRRESKVVYPPVDTFPISQKPIADRGYYLIISRIVGGKGLDLAVQATLDAGISLKIAGKPAGYSTEYKKLLAMAEQRPGLVEFLGFVDDDKLHKLYAGARAFLALAKDEDFGITPVEAMMAGTPVIAYKGGGYLESVIENVTGLFFDELSAKVLTQTIEKFEKSADKFSPKKIHQHALRFSKARFKREMYDLLRSTQLNMSHTVGR